MTKVKGIETQGDTLAREMITAQEFTRVMYRLTSILKKMGLGTDIASALIQVSRLIYLVRMLQMSIHFLQMSTPYGWIMGGLGLITTGLGLGTMGGTTQMYYEEIP